MIVSNLAKVAGGQNGKEGVGGGMGGEGRGGGLCSRFALKYVFCINLPTTCKLLHKLELGR